LVVFAKLCLYESKKSCSCLFKYFETFILFESERVGFVG
jgi:hypothetical protein